MSPSEDLPQAAKPPLGIFGLIADTIRLCRRGFGVMLLPALVPALISTALIWATSPDMTEFAANPEAAATITGAVLWSSLIDLVVSTLATGVLCLLAIDVAVGRRHGIGDYLRQAGRQFLPLLVITLVLSIAIGIGAVLFILPGLYVMARYFPYVAATVFENRGWQGIGRAEALTRGYRWPLVGTVVLFGMLTLAVVLFVVAPLGTLIGDVGALGMLLGSVLTAISYIVFASFAVTVYLRLRLLQEGATAADIAAAIG